MEALVTTKKTAGAKCPHCGARLVTNCPNYLRIVDDINARIEIMIDALSNYRGPQPEEAMRLLLSLEAIKKGV